MPLYEYHCPDCAHEFEQFVRSSVTTDTQCPRCGSHKVERRFSAFATRSGGTRTAPGTAPAADCGPVG